MQATDTFSENTIGTDTLTNRMTGKLGLSREKLTHMGHNIAQKSKDLARATDQCVHRNVWTSIFTSVATGLLVGMLMHRR